MRQSLRRALVALVLAVSAVCGASLPASAQSLDQARAAGYVGERTDGYLGVVSDGPGVQALVDEVNARRREVYEQTAQSSGQALSVVQEIAAERIISQQLAPGMFYMNGAGQWVQK